MFQYHPSNPFRSVAWRWELARTVREKKVRGSARVKLDDKVNLALKFQARLHKCNDDTDRWGVMDVFPDIYAAYLIHKRGNEDDRHPLRFVIEARLLAGQVPAEIAVSTGLTTACVEWYEQLFFNVADKLTRTDYIMTCVMGPSVYAGLSDRDYDLLWKLFGYIYGPTVLDSFISTSSRKFRPETMGEVDVALADDARSSIQRKVAIVARTYAVNPFSQSELLNIYARLLENEKESNNGKAQDVIMQNIQVMLDKLPWQSGGDDVAGQMQISHYDKGAVELRTNELLTLSVGKDLPQEVNTAAMVFPEPSNAKPAK